MTEPLTAPMELPTDPDGPDAMRAPVDEDARPVPPPDDQKVPGERDPEDQRPPGEPGLTA